MPNDFMNGNANSKSMSLNLDALGDAANQSASLGSGEKPILNNEVEATIVATDLRLMTQLQSNQNDPSKKYYNTVFAIETKFKYLGDNGELVEGTSRDNYGGLRYFVSLDEQGNVIKDATGQPRLDRLWLGSTSLCGSLFDLVQAFDSSIRSYSDFFNFWKTERKVLLKTKETNFGGKQFKKNVITKILG